MHEITLEHRLDAAHRVVGHKGKCARLHGHTYRFNVTVSTWELDDVGFVVDFGDIKEVLNEWDHRLLLWDQDPVFDAHPSVGVGSEGWEAEFGVVRLPVNPTSENLSLLAAGRILDVIDRPATVEVVASETPSSSSRATATRADRAPVHA